MSNTIIEVKCDDDTTLYFRKQGDNDWLQLAPTSSRAPTIGVTSRDPITFEFVKFVNSNFNVFFKRTQSALPTSDGPTLQVSSNHNEETNFAKDDTTHTFYVGYVAVNEDSR